MAPKWERRRSLTFCSFLLPQLKYLGLAAEPLQFHRNDSNRAQKKERVSHIWHPQHWTISISLKPTISHECFISKFLISVLRIHWRQKIGPHQISSTDQNKLADCMTWSFPTTSYFSVLLYISTPKTTIIILFTPPDFWNNVSGDFSIFSSLQRFPKDT